MSFLCTITDEDVFAKPLFVKPDTFEQRITVKAIVRNSGRKFALVTNDVHGMYLLPGGGAEVDDLESEIRRECMEEIGHTIKLMSKIGQTHELRIRQAKEYFTTCFSAVAGDKLSEAMRTSDERDNNLQVEWFEQAAATQIFIEQKKAVHQGDIGFYNFASCSDWLRWRDAFRTFDWYDAFYGSDYSLQQIRSLLALAK